MIDTLTLISLLRPTAAFAFNLKRMVRLLTVPVSLLTAVLAAVYYFPVFSLAETVELSLHFNVYMLLAIVFFFIFIPVSVMRHTQEILFFGEDREKSRLFVPKFDRLLLKCIFMCFLLFFLSVLLSVLSMGTLLAVVKRFIALPDQTNLLLFGSLFLLSPYFFIRFFLKLPALVAGRILGWRQAWRLTGRIGIMMIALFAMFLFIPMLIVTVVSAGAGKIAGAEIFLGTFGVSFAVLFSTVLFSAYCGYLYTYVTSKA